MSERYTYTLDAPMENPTIYLYENKGSVGTLSFKDGVLSFDGDLDASAAIFINHVIAKYDAELARLRKENADMLARLKQAGVPHG